MPEPENTYSDTRTRVIQRHRRLGDDGMHAYLIGDLVASGVIDEDEDTERLKEEQQARAGRAGTVRHPTSPGGTKEHFSNLFNMSNSSKDRNTMILIIVAILFFMYKDEIMKSGVVKSLKKMLK